MSHNPHFATSTDIYVRPEARETLTPEEVGQMRLYALMQQRAKEYAEAKRAAANR
jgi:hypothetical protein